MKTYLLTRSVISSSRCKSVFTEPVDLSNLRKTMGDSGLLAIESPVMPDNPLVTNKYTQKLI